MLGCLKYFEKRISLLTFSSKSFVFKFDFCRILAAIFCLINSCSPTVFYEIKFNLLITFNFCE